MGFLKHSVAATAGLALLGVAWAAGHRNMDENPGNGVQVVVPPGKYLKVSVRFPNPKKGNEVDVSVYLDKPRVRYFNSHQTAPAEWTWTSPVNATGGNQTYTVAGSYKLAPNPRDDWTLMRFDPTPLKPPEQGGSFFVDDTRLTLTPGPDLKHPVNGKTVPVRVKLAEYYLKVE